MAGEAYPTEPLYRYPWTNLNEAVLQQAVDGVATAGPGPQRAGADISLAGKTLRIAADGGPSLSYRFLTGNRLMLTEPGSDPIQAGYGAATIDHMIFFTHLIPGTTRGYAVMFDHDSDLATVVELWFGGEPRSREVQRHITHGYVVKDGADAPEARHVPTARVEGRGLFWTDVDVPSGGELNVALKFPADDPASGESPGICSSKGCYVALDKDDRFGWRVDDTGAVLLPLAACDAVREGAAEAVRVCYTHRSKTAQFPSCGPWSSVGED